MSENLRMQYLEEQYETLTTLGEQDTGRVFLVKDRRNGKIAVKKYVSAEAAGLYERLRGIKNRYMARIYETATDGQSGIVIEEYINGVTLGKLLWVHLYDFFRLRHARSVHKFGGNIFRGIACDSLLCMDGTADCR